MLSKSDLATALRVKWDAASLSKLSWWSLSGTKAGNNIAHSLSVRFGDCMMTGMMASKNARRLCFGSWLLGTLRSSTIRSAGVQDEMAEGDIESLSMRRNAAHESPSESKWSF